MNTTSRKSGMDLRAVGAIQALALLGFVGFYGWELAQGHSDDVAVAVILAGSNNKPAYFYHRNGSLAVLRYHRLVMAVRVGHALMIAGLPTRRVGRSRPAAGAAGVFHCDVELRAHGERAVPRPRVERTAPVAAGASPTAPGVLDGVHSARPGASESAHHPAGPDPPADLTDIRPDAPPRPADPLDDLDLGL